MISAPKLRKIARERGLSLDLIEKDYALGWILIGVSSSGLSDKIIFKGGTALSKVHFPSGWRLSEDLDFTLSEHAALEDVGRLLVELPDIVGKASDGLVLSFKEKPFINPGFLRVRAQYEGPITKSMFKIEVSKEAFVGDFERVKVPPTYDYPEFNTLVYTLNNILAEKLRAIIERGVVRDYYDAWKLLKTGKVDLVRTRALFMKKCEGKGVELLGVEQFFPDGLEKTLEPYVKSTLTRLCPEPLPPLSEIIGELKTSLTETFE